MKRLPPSKRLTKLLNQLPLLRLLILLGTVVLVLMIVSQRDLLKLTPKLGYLGVFLVNFIGNATVLFPLPSLASVFISGSLWNPMIVGVIASLGNAVGELVGYLLGYGGRGVINAILDGNHDKIAILEGFFKKSGFATIFVLALLPIPFFDLVGIIAGTLNYPIWKFFLATFCGRLLRNLVIAWSGSRILG